MCSQGARGGPDPGNFSEVVHYAVEAFASGLTRNHGVLPAQALPVSQGELVQATGFW